VADQSRGGDVVLLRQVLEQADQSVIGRRALTVEPFTTRLRGLDAEQRLVRLTTTRARVASG